MDDTTDLARTLTALGKYRHVSFVLVEGTRIENLFRKAFFTKLPPMSDDVKEALFGHDGPISGHANRLYVAQAFSMFTAHLLDDLQFIRKIRNAFAHSDDTMTFDKSRIKKLIEKHRHHQCLQDF